MHRGARQNASPFILCLHISSHFFTFYSMKEFAYYMMMFVIISNASAEGPLPGQVMVDPRNPMWLCRFDPAGNHSPFIMVGPADPEGFLYMGTPNPDGTVKGPQMQMIVRLGRHGGNSIYVIAVRTHGGDAVGDRAQWENPFIDRDPAKGVNPAILDQWDTWFRACDRYGIVVYFYFYDDGANPWGNCGQTVNDLEYAFMKQVVHKFDHLKHLIWNYAEEFEEGCNPGRVGDFCAKLRQLDRHDHIIGVSTLERCTFQLDDDPNVDQHAVQWNKSYLDDWHDGAVTAFRAAQNRYHINMLENTVEAHGDQVRKRLWAGIMGGAACTMNLWNDIQGATIRELMDMRNIQTFFESTDLYNMAPHDALAHAGTKYVLAKPGHSYIAYARTRIDTLGIKAMTAGFYDMHWYDIATGRSFRQKAVSVTNGDAAWPVPARFGAEVALHIRRIPKK